MKLILKQPFTAPTAAGGHVEIPAGEHEVARVPNPLGHGTPGSTSDWLVLAGRDDVAGAALGALLQWAGPVWDEFEIVVLDDAGVRLMPAEAAEGEEGTKGVGQ